MATERTFSIVKPDGVQKNLIGEIYRRFENAGLRVVAARMVHLRQDQAEQFYAVHKERPFYPDLVKYMTSGPVVVQVLEGDDAINKNRELMGATDPKQAAAGTIRADFADRSNARPGGYAIEQHGTSTAHSLAAAVLRAGELEIFS